MGYLYLMMVVDPLVVVATSFLTARQGVIISSAVVPALLMLLWNSKMLTLHLSLPYWALLAPLLVRLERDEQIAWHDSLPFSTREHPSTNTVPKLGL